MPENYPANKENGETFAENKMMNNFESFILCGGKSRRMGQNKALLKLGNQTLLERACSLLQNLAPQKISLVGNTDFSQINLSPEVSQITDEIPERGALGGIHTALSAAQSEWILVLACDYPFVSQDLLKFLHDKTISLANDFDLIIPFQPDRRAQPLCAFYRVRPCLEKTRQMLTASDKVPPVRSLIDLVKTYKVGFSEFAHLPNSQHFFLNLNTPEDFAEAQKIYATF